VAFDNDESIAKIRNDNKQNMSTPEQTPEYYIMVCVEKPPIELPAPASWLWLTLTDEIERNPTRFAGFEKLCENVWLFPEKTHLRIALTFLSFCQQIGDGRLRAGCKAYKILGKPEPWG
jgi:hypothetical protein